MLLGDGVLLGDDMLRFTVSGQYLERTDNTYVVADSQDQLYAEFAFSGWDGIVNRIARFWRTPSNPYDKRIVDGRVQVPNEVLVGEGVFYVSVFGGALKTASSVAIPAQKSPIVEGQIPFEPTPGLFDSVLTQALGYANDAAQSAEDAQASESVAVEKANSASVAKDGADGAKVAAETAKAEALNAKIAAETAKADALATEQRVIALMSTDTRSYFFGTLAERDAQTGLRHCDRCSVLETRADYIYDMHDLDGDEVNPEWIKTSDWDALKTVAWSIITGKPNFATVATSGSYTDLTDRPNRYESFITISPGATWDYNLSDKVICTLEAPSSINITNVYNGAIGMILVYGDELILPENSKKSFDFDYLTITSGQHYLYMFDYDGTYFHWTRTVCG